jgi:hypothetical protein
MVTIDDIGEASDNLLSLQERFLRERGWECSCDFPGATWLWCKEIGGRKIATDLIRAYGMESYEEELRLEAEEENQTDAQQADGRGCASEIA